MRLYPKKLTVQISTVMFAALQKQAYEEKKTIAEVVRDAISFDDEVHRQYIRYLAAKRKRNLKKGVEVKDIT